MRSRDRRRGRNCSRSGGVLRFQKDVGLAVAVEERRLSLVPVEHERLGRGPTTTGFGLVARDEGVLDLDLEELLLTLGVLAREVDVGVLVVLVAERAQLERRRGLVERLGDGERGEARLSGAGAA